MSTKNQREVDSYMTRDWEKDPPLNFVDSVAKAYVNVIAHPLENLHNYIVSKQEPTYWYHRKFKRVPTYDQCYTYDIICKHEANMQFRRDQKVDMAIIRKLKKRVEECHMYEGFEREKCAPIVTMLTDARENYYIKYGELGHSPSARECYMKQKHRLLWERRHGPVGTGMKKKYYNKDGTVYWA